jgi:hypothetical protein
MSATPTGGRAPVRSVALIILGSVLGLVALAVLAGGGGVLWADQTQRDSEGYFTGSNHRIVSGSYAVTHDDLKVDHLPGWVDGGKVVRLRIAATSESGRPLFIGIARERDADAYLANVAHSTLHDYDVDSSDQEYDAVGGTARPVPPASRQIWSASAIGSGSATLRWSLREGDWSVVLMNADGSKRVAADVKVGANIGYLGWVWAAMLVIGTALLAGAILLILRGGRRRGDEEEAAVSPTVAGTGPVAHGTGTYPAVLSAELDEPLSRGLWLVKWLLVIPHVIVLVFLWIAFAILTVVAWAAVLISGRYPRGIFDFNLGVLRWSWRVSYYSYGALGTDRYPPFSLEREPDYPATLDVAYPGRQSRLTALTRWVLALPHLLIVGVFIGGGAYWLDHTNGWHFTSPWSGLIGLLTLFAGFALLFSARYPRGLFDFIVGLNRWVLRVVAYAALMTDVYPPFRFDGGGEEPQAASAGPVAAAA